MALIFTSQTATTGTVGLEGGLYVLSGVDGNAVEWVLQSLGPDGTTWFDVQGMDIAVPAGGGIMNSGRPLPEGAYRIRLVSGTASSGLSLARVPA